MVTKEPSLIVDLGSSCLKVVRLGEGGRVASCDLAPLPQLSAEDIKSRTRQEGLVVDALKGLLQRIGPGRVEVLSQLSGRSVFIRRLKIIQMPKVELDKAIRFEARTTLPFAISEAILDYLVIRKFEEAGVKKQEVLILAVPQKALEEHLAILRRAGLEPVGVDISPFAYLRYFKQYYPDYDSRTFAYVDLGAEKTEIDVFRQGQVIFSRSLTFGGKNFTQAISEELGVGWEEAEELKKEYGYPLKLDKASLPKSAKAEKGWLAHEAVSALYAQLVTDLKRSLDYFHNQFPEAVVEKIFIGGGGAKAAGMEQFIGQNLDVAAEKVAQPAEIPISAVTRASLDKSVSSADWLPFFVGCLGLASWSASEVKINLAAKKVGVVAKTREHKEVAVTPQEVKEMRQAGSWVLGILAALLIGIFGWGFFLNRQIAGLENTLSQKKQELNVLLDEKKKLEQDKLGAEGRLAQYKELLAAIQQKPLMTSEVVDDLALLLPADIALTDLKVGSKEKKFTLVGVAANRNQLEKLLARLEEYPAAANYRLEFIRGGSPTEYLNQSFQISGELR